FKSRRPDVKKTEPDDVVGTIFRSYVCRTVAAATGRGFNPAGPMVSCVGGTCSVTSHKFLGRHGGYCDS
ncbi:MAG: hypothetical protein DMF47_04305, partial [Verrucomicrobia bacterium]